MLRGAILLLCAFAVFSCKEKREPREIDRGIYYWKSVLKLSGHDKQQLDSLKIHTVYVKFFDVVWDEAEHKIKTSAKWLVDPASMQFLQRETSAGARFNIVPTFFITNECLQKIDSSDIFQLADRIRLLGKIIVSHYNIKFNELQYDCDWTASTKDKYFKLLKRSKWAWSEYAFTLSATIRLHQIKFLSKSGVPPVDKGLLMCYNMGNLKDPTTNNSIIEANELKRYIGNLSTYPLPLDVALPIFDWKVLYRNNQYAGLIQNFPENVLAASFTKKNGNLYQILIDTLLQGYHLKKGDLIRNEQSHYNEIIDAATAVSNKLKNTQLRVSLYHLDSLLLSKYSTHELESIYNSLR